LAEGAAVVVTLSVVVQESPAGGGTYGLNP